MHKNKVIAAILVAAVLLSSGVVHAAPFAGESVIDTIKAAMVAASSNIASTAIIWLGAFASIQFFITNFGLLKSGADIEAVFAKFIGSIIWIAFCIYVLKNGPAFIESVGQGLFGIVGGMLSASDILVNSLKTAIKIFGAMIVGAAIPGIGNTLGTFLIYVQIFFLAVAVLFAFKIFMVQLELGLIIMLAPLSFAFLGMGALKDQGIAPFKALISLAYRIILMMVIMKAFNGIDGMISVAIDKFANLGVSDMFSPSNISDLGEELLSGVVGYMLLAYLLFKSDSIAATLASGTTNMGTADIAGAAAMGAAMGAAVATGGASAAGKMPTAKSMADFMKGQGGGELKNVSMEGVGGDGGGLTSPVSSSLADVAGGSSSGEGSNESENKFPTNSRGAPVKAAPAATSAIAGGGAASGGEQVDTGGNGLASRSPEGSLAKIADAEAPMDVADAASQAASNELPDGEAAGGSLAQAKAASDGAATAGGGGGAAKGSFGTNKHGAPMRSNDGKAAAAPVAGSGASAGIAGGGQGGDAQNTEARLANLEMQNGPRKASFTESIGDVNRMIANEHAATAASINVNAAD